MIECGVLPPGCDISTEAQPVCPPGTSTRAELGSQHRLLVERLATALGVQGLPDAKARAEDIAPHVCRSQAWHRQWKALLRKARQKPEWDILRWIAEARDEGNQDEALWRTFLAGHFGRPSWVSERSERTAGRFLCGFGSRPMWTWERVSQDPRGLRRWLERQNQQGALATLGFGNHRKYRSKQPEGIFRVISSFVEMVHEHDGTPSRAFTTEGLRPEAAFDHLHWRLREVWDFGRTGAFDTLCLMRDMGLLAIAPGSCYLDGATGPRTGAVRLWGPRPVAELDDLAAGLARTIGLRMEVIEGALCNWQKIPRRVGRP